MNALLSPVLDRPAVRPPADMSRLRHAQPFTAAADHETLVPDPELYADSGIGEDARLLCAKLALCVIEILAGARPLDQLGRWVSDAVFIQLLRRTVIAARSREVTGDDARRPRVRVGEPMLSRIGDSIVDAVVMIHQPTRSRAVALRLERHRTRWRATAISVL